MFQVVVDYASEFSRLYNASCKTNLGENNKFKMTGSSSLPISILTVTLSKHV